MAQVTGNKRYAIVVEATDMFSWLNFGFSYDDGVGDEPIPEVSAGSEAVPVSDDDLGALTEGEFVAQKKPVFVGGDFDSWTDKEAAPTVAIDVNPYDDGSNTPEVTITGGPASTDYDYVFTRTDVSCNQTSGTGTLDGSGEDSFKIKVFGQGGFTVKIVPRGNNEFQDGTLAVTVDAGPFV